MDEADQVSIRLPRVLRDGDDAGALDVLEEYFTRAVPKTGYLRTGALWDSWDPSGTRARDTDVFTAEDLVAVTFLSVQVPAQGVFVLLGDENAKLNQLLAAVGPDRDLVDESEPMTEESPTGRLETALRDIHGVGRIVASKLIARKRPRLYPIYDDVLGRELRTKSAHVEPVRQAMRERDGELHRKLLDLRNRAEIDESVPAVRILDVLAWMQGKGYKPNLT
ncbi:DUF6308 family protein [Rhodococcus sp. OK302]|uniref:DUF6308 family protein n=1 Tax=Rhodococcus sp. OK302 TaxID=1882769 RepID=UPI000B93FF89|nr:DUF6308 family protein [Rhodococcus sp. OK302]OYD67503.1 hypothetical protein BDB13_1027 [Rhodococcus sp. OK302]